MPVCYFHLCAEDYHMNHIWLLSRLLLSLLRLEIDNRRYYIDIIVLWIHTHAHHGVPIFSVDRHASWHAFGSFEKFTTSLTTFTMESGKKWKKYLKMFISKFEL